MAMLKLTHGFHSVHVLPKGQSTMVDRRGREVSCSGLVQGPAFNLDVLGLTRVEMEAAGVLRDIEEEAHNHMVASLAGPFAEGRYRRWGVATILLTFGSGDWERTRSVARWLWPDNEERQGWAIAAAERHALALVKDMWSLISTVAGILVVKGELLAEDVPFSLRREPKRTP